MGPIFFSIVITSLNPGDKLSATLRSVLRQEYGHFEVIIKDGGSEDGTFLKLPDGSWVVATQEGIHDGRIRVIRRTDSGIYDGMNQALPWMSGDYVLFLNCGDLLYDDNVLGRMNVRIQEQEERRQRGRLRIYYGDLYQRRLECVVRPAPELNEFALYRNVPCHQVCFYNTLLFKERGYDTSYRVRADYEHFLYSICEKKAEAVYVPLLVSSYEGGGFSETPENRRISRQEHKIITCRYMGSARAMQYHLTLMATLAPLRTRIAENPGLSRYYNTLKSAVYHKKTQ